MTTFQFLVLLVFLAAAWIGMGIALWRSRRATDQGRDPILQRCSELEQVLSGNISRVNADVAARIEQVKGDLRTELGDRLQTGLLLVQQTVDKQFIQGREEQSRNLQSQNLALKESRDELMKHLQAAEEQLRHVSVIGQSVNELNSLLRLPHLRGKFGEAELENLLAEFLRVGQYEAQATVVPGSRETVDWLIKFEKTKLPIDSKFNREQILPLFDTGDPGQLEDARKKLSEIMKKQTADISAKYIHPEYGTTDMALMFIPSELIYFEVIRNIELVNVMRKAKVFPVSPNTLAVALEAIKISFSFYEAAKEVETTLQQIKLAQKHLGNFQQRFEDVGKSLGKAQETFTKASTHLGHYTNAVVRLTGEGLPELSGEGEAVKIPPPPASESV